MSAEYPFDDDNPLVIDDCRAPQRDPDAPICNEDSKRWGWRLTANDGELTASRSKPYEGTLSYTTEDRYVPRGRNSRANLTIREVVDHFVRCAPTDRSRDELLELSVEAKR